MKRIYKILDILLIFFIVSSFINVTTSDVYAMTSSYAANDNVAEVNANQNSMLGVIADIILPMVYPLFSALARLTQKVMYVFTGTYTFPWADSILFNRLPFLDVNFINPEPGSLFMSSSGTLTLLGTSVRNVYFTVLSICLAFFGIAVAINVIKMLLASLPSAKARYKEMINTTLISLVLIFGMHYLISFVFYINEQLVQIASNMAENVLSGDMITAAAENLTEAEEKDNEKLLENFFDKCNHTSWWSPITIVKTVVKTLANVAVQFVNWINDLGEAIKDAWNSFWGNESEDDTLTLAEDDKKESGYYGKVFPNKEDFIGYFDDESIVGKHGKDIAAYLLKDYMYRDGMLSMVAGNDTNKFVNAGLKGWLQSGANTILWFTGIVDTGLQGLQNLYTSVCFINRELKDQPGVDVSSAAACKATIEKFTAIEQEQTDDASITAAHIKTLYVKAYYRYVYEGADKDEYQENTSMIQNLGEYFKRNMYYIDVDSGQWSPNTFDAIMCILYCVFVLQSFMFLFSYIKRFLYVVILAVLGPVTIVFDYIMKSY